ncbi:uncharacterized protein [Lolium perenne]|uniref:uncharacterized protein n=1 Tax=Lolium perenne TaxID=4522 RepID=UPI003A998AFD
MVPVIKQHLERAQRRMKHQADKKRDERSFQIGDWVYLRLQPYVQRSVVHRSSHKLGFNFFGPYKIIQKVGNVSYKLQLPGKSKVHPVIHVSQLKKAIRATNQVSTELPDPLLAIDMQVQPQAICGERLVRRGYRQVPQIKVQWEGMAATCCTWELLHAMVTKYPQAPAWGQATSRGDCHDTSVT